MVYTGQYKLTINQLNSFIMLIQLTILLLVKFFAFFLFYDYLQKDKNLIDVSNKSFQTYYLKS